MFHSEDAKEISTLITTKATEITATIRAAVESSVVGRDEVPFIKELALQLPSPLDAALIKAGVSACTRAVTVHQKPRVSYKDRHGVTKRCELGDLVVIVKYLHRQGQEVKTVVHQMKSSVSASNTNCKIDETQLELLHDWPEFAFGKRADGAPQTFAISPGTMEFGTYTLMLRRPSVGQYVNSYKHDYGVCPSAWRVESSGPHSVDIARLPFTLAVSTAIFNHVAFNIGESHANPAAKALVEALYRFVGWEPDPPDEFDDYYNDYRDKPNDGVFVMIETRIELQAQKDSLHVAKPKPMQ